MRKGKEGERGATLVEAALVYGILFLAIFAVVEFGLAFKDWLSVSHASREAATVGATLGRDPLADIEMLDAVANTLEPIGFPLGTDVRIYNASNPATGTTYDYAPNTDCGADPGYSFADCCDWSPCPEVGRPNYTVPLWDPNSRDDSAPVTDRLGVEIVFSHDWVTGFFASSTDFTTATEYQIEPQVFS